MGLAFLGLAAIWAVLAADALDGDALRWLLPVPWLVAGAAGLLATTLGRRTAPRWGPLSHAQACCPAARTPLVMVLAPPPAWASRAATTTSGWSVISPSTPRSSSSEA